MKFEIEDGFCGPRFVLKSEWTQSVNEYLITHDIKELSLNYAKGWKYDTVEFLRNLPGLTGLHITAWNIESINPIHSLHNLKDLYVATYCKTPIDFNCFPELIRCGIEWRAKSESLFQSKTITDLFVNNYNNADIHGFGQMTQLKHFKLLSCPTPSLQKISHLTQLSTLDLRNLKKLTSLHGIEGMTQLKELSLISCSQISSIAEVASLSDLTTIYLINLEKIDSLSPLQGLNRLETIGFTGTSYIVDGDMEVLTSLSNLRSVAFMNRKHYSLTREEVRGILTKPD